MDKTIWVAIHHHRHGEDLFFLRSDGPPSEAQFIKQCEIDFEPDREEWLEVCRMPDTIEEAV